MAKNNSTPCLGMSVSSGIVGGTAPISRGIDVEENHRGDSHEAQSVNLRNEALLGCYAPKLKHGSGKHSTLACPLPQAEASQVSG